MDRSCAPFLLTFIVLIAFFCIEISEKVGVKVTIKLTSLVQSAYKVIRCTECGGEALQGFTIFTSVE